jgi:hypothetical protein
MRLLNFIRALFTALFSRATIILIFWIVTIIACIQVMLRSSLVVGSAALVACAMCYAGAAGFMGSLIARREKGYRVVDLIGIGSLALILIAAGLGVMMWSGFSIRVFDIAIGGVTWALLGALSAVVVVRVRDAL